MTGNTCVGLDFKFIKLLHTISNEYKLQNKELKTI